MMHTNSASDNPAPQNRLRLSVLDLSPISSGQTSANALANSLDLARFVDTLGYTRYWFAEHHNTALTACSAPEILIGHAASITENLRVGSGGVMLPNHAPLKVAENFRTLEALHPNRIDIGLGRAPGTDPLTALALRRSRNAVTADDFPEQLNELRGFLGEAIEANSDAERLTLDVKGAPQTLFRRIKATPDGVAAPPIYLLGSSDYSARLAAQQGLGFAFAHHINPGPAVPAVQLYNALYQPTDTNPQPHSLIAVSAICAPTDDEAEELARSADLVWLRFQRGNIAPIPSLEEANAYPYTEMDRAQILMNRERLFVGSPETLHTQLSHLAQAAGTREIMVTTLVHDHEKRKRSYELLAQAFALK